MSVKSPFLLGLLILLAFSLGCSAQPAQAAEIIYRDLEGVKPWMAM